MCPIIFQNLDQDLPSLLKGIRFEYIENSLGPDANYVELNVGNNVLKGTDQNYKTVIRAMQYTGTIGFKIPGKFNQAVNQLGSMNPTPYDVKLGWNRNVDISISGAPTKMDSIRLGIPIAR